MKYGCLTFPSRFHSYQPSAGTRQRWRLIGLRNAGLLVTVSDLALIMRFPTEMLLAQLGTSPQRISRILRSVRDSSRSPASSRG